MTTLAEFVAFAHAHLLDVQTLGEGLRAFGRSGRREIRELLATGLLDRGNPYRSGVIVLHRDARVLVRLVQWSVDEGDTRAYDTDVAHTHATPILTYGLSGPGYTTLLHACDPEELHAARIGDEVALGEASTHVLAPDTTFYYPTDSLAHAQRPPASYSISLNLLLLSTRVSQYFIDRRSRCVIEIERPPWSADAVRPRARWVR